MDADDGEPVSTCTVNIDEFLSSKEVVIKNYSENEGMLDFLIKEGIVKDTGKRVQLGYVEAPIVTLLV